LARKQITTGFSCGCSHINIQRRVKMTKGQALLRKEVFGGTLFNSDSGKRAYINRDEYESISQSGSVPEHLQREIQLSTDSVLIREPSYLPGNNFSAPDTIFFEITRACNINCTFCFNNSGRRMSNEMSDAQRLRLVQDLINSGVQEVRLTGGEPLVVNVVYDIIRLLRRNGLRTSIGTNGILVKPDIARRLADVGLNLAVVSVDGMRSVHDSIRGAGSFRKTMKGIIELKHVGIPVRVNTVVMKSNIDEVVRVTEFFSNLSVPVMIRRLIPAGRADNMSGEMLSQEEYEVLRKRLGHLTSDSTKHVRGHYIKDDKVAPRISLPFERQSCSAGHRGMVVLPDGNVQTCGFLGPLGEMSVGNLVNERFSGVWRKLVDSQHIESMRFLLPGYNSSTSGPKTNCLAIALALKSSDVQPLHFMRSK